MIRVGTAGWALSPAGIDAFPASGSHLERYAAVFDCAEINSSFHRPHRAATYARWGAAVPASFRFSVKIPKTITHGAKLVASAALLDEFMAPVQALGDKLGCLLVQLPPKLEYRRPLAARFFGVLRRRHAGAIALEARNPSWFEDAADAFLAEHRIARVAADPPRSPRDGTPGGWRGIAYHRLHGAPRMYYSAYGPARLDPLAGQLEGESARANEVWCVFDNTAGRAAIADALHLREKLAHAPGGSSPMQRKDER